jgi:hypothetical protein
MSLPFYQFRDEELYGQQNTCLKMYSPKTGHFHFALTTNQIVLAFSSQICYIFTVINYTYSYGGFYG